MSRAPGGFAINDIRSTAILQEYVYTTEPCAAGSVARRGLGPCHPGLLDCGAPPYGFDHPKDNVTIIAATVIVATVIGLLNSIALFIPVVQREYGMGFVEICFAAGLTYAVVIKTSCLGCLLVEWVGHRLTAMFGMLLVFVGILLDSQVIHFAVYYVAHILFIGIGGGLAYSAAMCIPGDIFRKMLVKGMILVCIGGRIGTILFYWFTLFLLSHISYKWTKLCLAIIVLLFTAATNLLPSFAVDQSCANITDSPDKSQRDREIKDCVEKAAKKEKMRGPKHPNEKSCLCVCVCDISLWSDWSFLLWAICVFLATMALFVPYMYIITYAHSVGVNLSPWYITILCVGSIVGRVMILIGNDYTFGYNRTVFIGTCILSGILWLLLELAQTFGWILVWCAAMGLVEGIIVCVIPRLTLVTIPRRWMEHSWSWILWFHAVGIFVVTVFVGVVVRELLDLYIAFLTIGICQIIGGIIAILLPNEEGCAELNSVKIDCDPCAPTSSSYMSKYRNINRSTTASIAGPFSSRRSNFASTNIKIQDFTCNCPICQKAGCIPGCSGCVPGGLSSGAGAEDPCAPNSTTNTTGASNTTATLSQPTVIIPPPPSGQGPSSATIPPQGSSTAPPPAPPSGQGPSFATIPPQKSSTAPPPAHPSGQGPSFPTIPGPSTVPTQSGSNNDSLSTPSKKPRPSGTRVKYEV